MVAAGYLYAFSVSTTILCCALVCIVKLAQTEYECGISNVLTHLNAMTNEEACRCRYREYGGHTRIHQSNTCARSFSSLSNC